MAHTFDYDIIILGGGSAGIVSGVMAGALKMRVLLIEKGKMGGECLNTGCVPSKALIHAAKVAHTIRTAAQVGIKTPVLADDATAGVMAHVRETITQVQNADATEQLLRENGVEIRHGSAHFTDSQTLVLDGKRLTAQNFILATGSHPTVPDVPGLREAGFVTNQTVFDLDSVPKALLVVGGGPNGVEMAQAFGRLGSQVTLVEAEDRLLARDDSELAAALERHLRREGVDVRLNSKLASVQSVGGRRVATILRDNVREAVACDEILVSVGRAPNTDGLNLEAAGVEYDGKRVQTDAQLRTTAEQIYACGDLLGAYQFSHMAEYEAKTVVRNIVFPGAAKADFRLDPWTTFTDPEVAHLGLTEDEAKAQGIPHEVYRQPFAQNDRAITDNETEGFIKVLTQGLTGKILGVQIFGPRAGELLQEWTLAMQHGHSIREVGDMVHVYPTLSMACQHVAQRWYERKSQEPLAQKGLDTYAKTIRPREKALAWGALGLTVGVGLIGWLASRRGEEPR
ncbi:MAG: FAD-dependent oxidoreductase [Armatimonadota bacterium]|nr:FAD-dependent oxidoreductase [Armatimonadota bacterium]